MKTATALFIQLLLSKLPKTQLSSENSKQLLFVHTLTSRKKTQPLKENTGENSERKKGAEIFIYKNEANEYPRFLTCTDG